MVWNNVIDTKEESDKELNSPKLVEGSTNPEPKVEPEEEIVKLSVELESTTPMLTSANAIFETWMETLTMQAEMELKKIRGIS
ncbi:hypothetical protein PVK06_043123 [Gossypium arboreum]|uniref:Uncharacterized protein n=1 Tax=Gossypium arboreum TaxID=29729 RepID=A0ABR0MPE1_GOSAR|nr:hypothetical protein PVK06_043123 [Gossypium arboreum]